MGLVDSAKAELAAVESFIQKQGGVSALVKQFEQQGLGSIVKSWVGNGANHPITADQIQRAFGYEKLQEVGSKLGLSVSQIASKLAELLPTTVDKLTSGGAYGGANRTSGSGYWGRRK